MNLNNPIWKIAIIEFKDTIRNKWLYFFTFLLFGLSSTVLFFSSDNSSKAIVTLLNLTLLIIPLFSILFSSLSFIESLPFFKSILTRPITRKELYLGKWIGINLSLNLSLVFSFVVPFVLRSVMNAKEIITFIVLIVFAILLNLVFSSIAFIVSSLVSRKELILSICLGIWFYLYIIYDVLILGLSIFYGEYPLELPVLALISLNPIDLARIVILLQLDVGVLLGFTAAFFQKYLGNSIGITLSLSILMVWVISTLITGLKLFLKKDL